MAFFTHLGMLQSLTIIIIYVGMVVFTVMSLFGLFLSLCLPNMSQATFLSAEFCF